jgi:DNA-binding Lrp family transcriptional regulator
MVRHVQVGNSVSNNITSQKNNSNKKHYTDLLVYACLKKYMDKTSKISVVTLRQIAAETNLSLGGIQTGIKRLEESKDIEKIKVLNKNQNGYKFNAKSEKFEMFDYDFLDNEFLTVQQKSFMIAVQKYLYVDKTTGIGKTTYSNKELAMYTGISERVIMERRKELEQSGFISRRLTTDKDGNSCEALEFNLPKFGQHVLCKLEEHDKMLYTLDARSTASEMRINKLESIIRMAGIKIDIEDAVIEL